VARASRRARLQRDSSNRSHLFSFNLFQRTRRHSLRDRDRATGLHFGRKAGRARYASAPSTVDGIRALPNRARSAADKTSGQTMRPPPDFIHEFVPGTSDRTLLLLHGTGGNEHDLIPLGRELDPNAALLSPRGKVLENGMPRFFRRLAEGVFDIEDLKQRTNELADFIAAAAQHYKLAADQVVAVGYSNGANIAASMLLLRPEILRAPILFRAMVPLVPENLPNLSSVRVWIGAGDQDPIIPASEAQGLVELLRRAGADVTIRFANATHGLTDADVKGARLWLEKLKRSGARR